MYICIWLKPTESNNAREKNRFDYSTFDIVKYFLRARLHTVQKNKYSSVPLYNTNIKISFKRSKSEIYRVDRNNRNSLNNTPTFQTMSRHTLSGKLILEIAWLRTTKRRGK